MRPVDGESILVVEDDPEVLEVMVDALFQAGYAPRFTTESRDAARWLEAADFGVVVSDVLMPPPNGLELLDLAKRQNPAVQVVLVTGHATPALARDALHRGATAFLEKPLDIEELVATVRQALGRWCLHQWSTLNV